MRIILFYIAILNLVDVILTMYGLHFAFISEANPLMNSLYHVSPFLFMLVKTGLSVLLFILLFYLKTPKKSSRILLSVSLVAAISYTFICILHGYWILEMI
ncbi:DUF5658 family protein [Rossellomorea aquimaris]|uniref:DUF5658 family protein n=1 Tax=Rossellomorea aquimaris TaxID=189382 RepID=UPI0007D0AD25|nr:DUF5658 family protein [Rossellomorea aquimaris]